MDGWPAATTGFHACGCSAVPLPFPPRGRPPAGRRERRRGRSVAARARRADFSSVAELMDVASARLVWTAMRGTGLGQRELLLHPIDGTSISAQRTDTDLVAEASLYPVLA
jgi:hypothetical protein